MFSTSRHEAEHFSYALLSPIVAAVFDNRHRRQTFANQLHWDEALIMAWKSWEESSHSQGVPMAHPFCLSRLDPEAGKHAAQGLSSAQRAYADVKDEKRKCQAIGAL